MTWTAVTRAELVEIEGVWYFFTAGEDLSRGMAVKIGTDGKVYKGDADNEMLVGIAAHDVDSGDPVTVYGTGSLVYARCSGAASNYTEGTVVGLGVDGYLSYNNSTYPKAVVVDAPSATNGVAKVLIL